MALVRGYSASVSETYGAMTRVVVAIEPVRPGDVFTPALAGSSLELREVPSRFAPAGALIRTADAVGLEASVPLPAGSYLTRSFLAFPKPEERRGIRAGRGRVPVEVSVSGASAVSGPGTRVDVLVTSEAEVGRKGSTAVVAVGVPLLAVAGPDSAAGSGVTRVVLGLPRRQAIQLVDAEAFARRITILGRPPG
jgi:Flp pilus assembly protein CpaB